MTQIYCKVGYCRFKFTHATKGHKCGKCNEYGHGDYECTHHAVETLKQDLEEYFNDVLPDNIQCTVADCSEKKYHTKEAHHCSHCGKREQHTIEQCSKLEQTYNVKCPDCRTEHNNIKIQKIFITSECKICLDNNIDVSLPCGHCYCMECFKSIVE